MSEQDAMSYVTKPSKMGALFKALGVIIIFVLVYLGAAVATGFISALSNNVETSTFSLIFDSQITIAYLLMYYMLIKFYKLTDRQNYLFFVSALLLSFTTNFIQGALTLLILPPLLKKFRLVQATE
jgi:hypothetical protein